MAWWRKGILVLLVCAVHITAIRFLDSAASRSGSGPPGLVYRSAPLTVTAAELVERVAQPATAKPAPVARPDSVYYPADPSRPPGPDAGPLREPPGLRAEDFLDPELVDQTAQAEDSFDTVLKQSAPLFFSDLELELWVDSEGQVVRVLCAGADCSGPVAAELQRLMGQRLKPAEKSGVPVASKKRLQLQPVPTFGL